MNRFIARVLLSLVVIVLTAYISPELLAATATLSGQVNSDSNNRPFFNSSVSANPGGYSGSVASNASTISNVTGTGFQRAGTSILADLSDGNHIPMGVTIVHDVSFRVTGSANLRDGGAGGLGI